MTGQSATLLAYAFCYSDRIITPIEARFGSGGELLTKGPDGWIQGRWGQEKTIGWLTKIKEFIQGDKNDKRDNSL